MAANPAKKKAGNGPKMGGWNAFGNFEIKKPTPIAPLSGKNGAWGDQDDIFFELPDSVCISKATKTECVTAVHARELAQKINLREIGARYDVFTAGNFIFGDFIAELLVQNRIKAKRMVISTLSLSESNINCLENLAANGWVSEIGLILSGYFFAHENHVGGLIDVLRQKLFGRKWGAKLAVAAIHTKTVQILTISGRKLVMHGSANLRSSESVEQTTIENNPGLFDFYDGCLTKLFDKFAAIPKRISNMETWGAFQTKNPKNEEWENEK